MVYQIQQKDIPQAGLTLSDAFHEDVIWKLFYKEGTTVEQKASFFSMPAKYCLKYGGVIASSPKVEGAGGWVPGEYADMSFVRMLGLGMMSSGRTMFRHATPLMRKQSQIFKPLHAARKEAMKDRDFLYLMILGVQRKFHGQGYGSSIVKALIKKSEQERLPIYLETETESNVRFYEHLGFSVITEVMMPVIDLPQWTMIREIE